MPYDASALLVSMTCPELDDVQILLLVWCMMILEPQAKDPVQVYQW